MVDCEHEYTMHLRRDDSGTYRVAAYFRGSIGGDDADLVEITKEEFETAAGIPAGALQFNGWPDSVSSQDLVRAMNRLADDV